MNSSYPPHRSLPSTPISPALALKHLQAYLAATTTNASLLPNATLQPTGPTAQGESLTIYNLRRVEAGLRGEWLAPVLEFDDAEVGNFGGMGEGGDWIDLDEYQREQSIGDGEIRDGAFESEIDVVADMEFNGEEQGELEDGVEIKKAMRKKLKQEKRAKERKEKEARKRRDKQTREQA